MEAMHLDAAWLSKKYVVEELSTYDIAKLVSRDPKRIYEKLKDFGIVTRPRGHNLSGSDNYMKTPGAINPFQGRRHSSATREKLSKEASKPKPYLRGARNGMAGRTGKLNPNYIDGSSPERQRLYAQWENKAFLRSIYERDNYHCKRCGSPNKGRRGLHVHHLRSWAGNPALRFDKSNVITLCRRCHEWVHSSKNVEKEYLVSILALPQVG